MRDDWAGGMSAEEFRWVVAGMHLDDVDDRDDHDGDGEGDRRPEVDPGESS